MQPPGEPRVPLADGAVDLQREVVHRQGTVEVLTTREAALLAYLAARPGEPVSREVLQTEVWGYSASVISRTVDTTVRRLRRKIEADPARPAHLLTVHGIGYRFEPVVEAPAADPLVPLDALVGRERALAEVEEALRTHRLVTLVGGPGTGKTRLAREVGQRARSGGDPVWLCEAGGDLAQAVAARAGVALDARARVGQILAGHPGLWILDEADRSVAAAAELLPAWLSVAPGVRFLVTSCERLDVPGEAVVELGPLDPAEAVALLEQRSAAAGARWHDSDVLRAVAERLDHLPLALELAAARAHVLSPPALLSRLDDPLRALGATSLRAALDEAWDALRPAERATLAQASVFPGSFTVDALEAVVSLRSGDPLEALAVLRKRSLVQARRQGHELRFWLLRSVRAHAAERLGDPEPVRTRLCAWLLAHGEGWAAELDGPGALEARARLQAERRALLAAWRQAPPDEAARLVAVADALFQVQGPAEARLQLLDAAIERLGPRPELAWRRAEALRVLGRFDEAARDLRGAGDTARAHIAASFLALTRGDVPSAEAAASSALERAATPAERVLAHLAAGLVARRAGRAAEAEAALRRALEEVRASGVVRLEGVVLGNLANLRRAAGHDAEAEQLVQRAVDAHRALGQLPHEAGALHNLAGLRAERGDVDGALAVGGEALEVAQRAGDALVVAHLLHLMGHLRHRRGELQEAELLYIEAIGRLRSLDPGLAASALGDLGAVQADAGRLADARRTFSEAEAGLQDEPSRAVLAVHRGHLALARGQVDEAREICARARRTLAGRGRMALQLLEQTLEARR